jgi:hypothetical protein
VPPKVAHHGSWVGECQTNIPACNHIEWTIIVLVLCSPDDAVLLEPESDPIISLNLSPSGTEDIKHV